MQKITRITTQQKNKQRYNIFLGNDEKDQYGFSVDEAILIEHRLHKGMELEKSQIEALMSRDDFYKSYTLSINFLSYRMRTEKEIGDYLKKKEIDEVHIPDVIDKLRDEKLLDDRAFAEMFVRTRIQTSTKGPGLVERELIEKGVSKLIAKEAVELYTFDIQMEKASTWIDKKVNTRKKDSYRKQLEQLHTTLMQKGFSQDIIKEIKGSIKDDQDDDAEWESIVHQGEKLVRKHEQKLTGSKLKGKVKEALYRKGFPFELINRFIDEMEV